MREDKKKKLMEEFEKLKERNNKSEQQRLQRVGRIQT